MHSKYFYITILLISLLVTIYFTRSTLSLYSAKNTLYTATNKLEALKKENDQIKKEIEYRKTDSYVINEAREKLNYGFNGERIVIVPKTDANEEKSMQDNFLKQGKSDKKLDKQNIVDESPINLWVETFF